MATAVVELESKALTIPEQAKQITIKDQAGLDLAGELLKGIKALRKEIDATFDPIIGAAFKAHREAVAQKKKVEAPLAEAENIVKPRIAGYLQEQERIRLAEQRRLEEEARKRAEEEALAAAVEAEQAGATEEEVQSVLAAPVPIVPVSAPPTFQKVQGISTRDNWSAEVIDKAALVRAAAANSSLLALIEPNIPALNGMARSLKSAMNIPGVRAVNRPVVNARVS